MASYKKKRFREPESVELSIENVKKATRWQGWRSVPRKKQYIRLLYS